MAKARIFDGSYGSYCITCPGCNQEHIINTKKPNHKGAMWSFNDDLNSPTFSPSLHIRTGLYVDPNIKGDPAWLKENSVICHSFIRDGKIEYLNDCTHHLKGQTVDLPDRY